MGIRTLSGRTQSFKLNGGGSFLPQFLFDASLSSEWASALRPGELKVSIPMVAAALNPNLGLTQHSHANGTASKPLSSVHTHTHTHTHTHATRRIFLTAQPKAGGAPMNALRA